MVGSKTIVKIFDELAYIFHHTLHNIVFALSQFSSQGINSPRAFLTFLQYYTILSAIHVNITVGTNFTEVNEGLGRYFPISHFSEEGTLFLCLLRKFFLISTTTESPVLPKELKRKTLQFATLKKALYM